MSWNNGENRNFSFKLKSKVGLYRVALKPPKTSPAKHAITVNEMQPMVDFEKIESKEKISRLNWKIYIGRRKVCVNFKTDTDKINIVLCRYRNSLYQKDIEVDLKLTEYQALLTKLVYLLSYIDIFYNRFIVPDKTTVHN